MIATLTEKLLNKLRRRSYRAAYVDENVRTSIAYQVRALREQRGWSQKKLAEVLGKPQSVVSRIEDPDYGKLSVQTLLEIAEALDIALLIRYVSFPDFITSMINVSPEALGADSFDESQLSAVPDRPRYAPAATANRHNRTYTVRIGYRADEAQVVESATASTGGAGLSEAVSLETLRTLVVAGSA